MHPQNPIYEIQTNSTTYIDFSFRMQQKPDGLQICQRTSDS